ncbi:hypothetical protein QEH59_08190 [Coraliomargarita sp. SDUM461004]|uniref:DUF2066 domain-containing protein n=1 Tax=Thalassobacterium sedimentorum TaxID=3041258 RepID=A0ABU1AHV5_9BACT|nr:hypothetical protein [Coraliomargarita sp. SDUM461004]MDQ8194402.1 hypothetical protein [Coraliomargarita sp. SDUM461004]
MDTIKRLVCIACFCVFAQQLFAHGPAQTSVRMDVYEDRAEVRVDVTMPDLMKMAGDALAAEIESAPRNLREFAIEYQGEVQKHFKLIDDSNEVLLPTNVWAQLPNFSDQSVQNLGIDQQRIEVVLAYALDTPPASLAVMFDIGQDHHGEPAYADCILRQRGEMIMLPAKVGPGFPIQFAFVWDEPLQPIHKLSSLEQASIGWENRPVVSYLQQDGARVRWSVIGPLSAWGESAYDYSRMSDHKLAQVLAAGFAIHEPTQALKRSNVAVARFPLSTFDYRRGRHVARGQPDATLVRLDMTFSMDAEAQWLEAACLRFPDLSPRLFLSAWLEGRGETFEVMHAVADSFRWEPASNNQLSRHVDSESRNDADLLN